MIVRRPGWSRRDPAMRGGGDFLFAAHGCWPRARPAGRRSDGAARRAPPGRRRAARRRPSNRRRSPPRRRRAGETARPAPRPGPGTARRLSRTGRTNPGSTRQRAKRPGGEPGIGQQHRRAAAVRRQNEIGPQLGFDPDRQIGMPVIEKALDRARQIDRHELMPGARRQAGFTSRAAATVPVVINSSMAGRSERIRSISASTELASPTLAACTQTRAPPDATPRRCRSARRGARGPPCRAGTAR